MGYATGEIHDSSVPTCTNSGACSDCAVLRVRTCDTLSESRMPKNGHRPQGGPSGSMSGSVKTVHGVEHEGTGNRKGRQPTKPAPKPPRHLSTLQFVSECYRIILQLCSAFRSIFQPESVTLVPSSRSTRRPISSLKCFSPTSLSSPLMKLTAITSATLLTLWHRYLPQACRPAQTRHSF